MNFSEINLEPLNELRAIGHLIMLFIHYSGTFLLKKDDLDNISPFSILIFRHYSLIFFPIIFVSNGINCGRMLVSNYVSFKQFRIETLKFYFHKLSPIIPLIYIYYLNFYLSNFFIFKSQIISQLLSRNIALRLLFINSTFNVEENVSKIMYIFVFLRLKERSI